MEVRIPKSTDIDKISAIHKESFDGFFLSELGDYFLKVYYSAMLNNDRGILLGCYDNSELVGFCAATTFSKGFNSQLIKSNFYSFLKVGISLLISKPLALIRIFKNLDKSNDSFEDNGEYAELFSIGVLPSYQGRGVGKLLVEKLECILKTKNIQKLSLTTDYNDNEKVLSFYRKNNYQDMYVFYSYPKRKMYRLIKYHFIKHTQHKKR